CRGAWSSGGLFQVALDVVVQGVGGDAACAAVFGTPLGAVGASTGDELYEQTIRAILRAEFGVWQ
ncbi:hypothetical protein, partial [Streptomyces sp. AK02-01A]|uniref:hypothetical protein n=1 Tax=Streptomyces sp. AK02-01A TaxID=3028648 RepID=UPI0029B43866